MDTNGQWVPGQEADAVARMRDMMAPVVAQQATGFAEWGRQDSNLEPTDYESRSDPHGPAADLR